MIFKRKINVFTFDINSKFSRSSICIIDNSACRRRTQNARFRARRADHYRALLKDFGFVQIILRFFYKITPTNIKNVFLLRNS